MPHTPKPWKYSCHQCSATSEPCFGTFDALYEYTTAMLFPPEDSMTLPSFNSAATQFLGEHGEHVIQALGPGGIRVAGPWSISVDQGIRHGSESWSGDKMDPIRLPTVVGSR